MKNKVLSVWSEIQQNIDSVVEKIRMSVSSKLDILRQKVADIWQRIKEAISKPVNEAKEAVHNAIEAIKKKFDFKWSLPHLKLPHPSISGHFSLDPPSVPHFSIDWYKKAMDNGMILNSPTIFGMQGNSLLAGGEAGSETVVGTQSLIDMIRDAVANVAGMTVNYGGVTLNVYAAQGMDEQSLGRYAVDELERKLSQNVIRRRAALGV